MEYLYTLAAANYNCENTDYSAYGEGGYGTCTTAATDVGTTATTTAPGAPNTGFFSGMVTSGSFSIIAPLVIAIIVVATASIVVHRKRTTEK